MKQYSFGSSESVVLLAPSPLSCKRSLFLVEFTIEARKTLVYCGVQADNHIVMIFITT